MMTNWPHSWLSRKSFESEDAEFLKQISEWDDEKIESFKNAAMTRPSFDGHRIDWYGGFLCEGGPVRTEADE
jgi:hypothetical protein